jgi:NAD(P)-dependent dehydrogenase (short-subunit alcohol dehydrogenase family)
MAPLERLGEPTDIAGAVSFLLGPDGGWVHGQVLRVNGGFALSRARSPTSPMSALDRLRMSNDS